MKLNLIFLSVLIFFSFSCDRRKNDINIIDSYSLEEIYPYLKKADSALINHNDTTDNSLIQIVKSEKSEIRPIFSILNLNRKLYGEESFIDSSSTILGYVAPQDTSMLYYLLREEQIKPLLPANIKWLIINNKNSFNFRLIALKNNSSRIDFKDSFIKEIILKPTGIFNIIGMISEEAINKGVMPYEAWINIDKRLLKERNDKSFTLFFKVNSIKYSCSIPKNYYEKGDLIFVDVFEKENLSVLKNDYKGKIIIK